MDRLSLLAVFAHPDDESYGPGGTLAKCAAQGVRLALLCATRGEAGGVGNPPLCTQEELGQVREQELRCACQALGISELRFLGYRDGTLDSQDHHEIEEKIVRAIRELRPEVVLTFPPDGVSLHPDHMVVHRCATAAFLHAGNAGLFPQHGREGLAPYRPQKLYYVALRKKLLQEIGVDFPGHDDHITTEIDVSQYVDTKLRAIRCHRTQTDFPDISEEQARQYLSREHFWLAFPATSMGGSETDLFQNVTPQG